MPKGEEVEAVVTGPSHFEARQRFENLNLFSEKNGSFLPHLVMPSAAKSEWTEENLPLRLLYSMMSLMAALTSSMLSTPLVLFFQKQTCRRYQSSSSRSSGAKNSTLRPQELLSSSFCRRESADRGKQWVTTSSRPSSFGKQSTHWILEAKQIKHLSKPLCE